MQILDVSQVKMKKYHEKFRIIKTFQGKFTTKLYTSSDGYNSTWAKWADNLSCKKNCLIANFS